VAATHDIWWQDAQEELEVARLLRGGGTKRTPAFPRQAYHHAGQAVEFALKSIYLKRKTLIGIPDDLMGRAGHDLEFLAERAALGPEIKQLQGTRKVLLANWLTARAWRSNARFPGDRESIKNMQELVSAVTHKPDGVMLWLESIFQKS
jgi:HEPN domain-containing protein